MLVKATREEVIDAACRAVAASRPMGLGFLHYSEAEDSPDRAEVAAHVNENEAYIDYFHGRMVKFAMRRTGENEWEGGDVSHDYQSWCGRYPTYEALFVADGGA